MEKATRISPSPSSYSTAGSVYFSNVPHGRLHTLHFIRCLPHRLSHPVFLLRSLSLSLLRPSALTTSESADLITMLYSPASNPVCPSS